MPLYNYKALDSSGRKIAGKMAAPSVDGLKHTLSHNSLLLQNATIDKGGGLTSFSFRKKVKMEEFLLFNQEVTAMLQAGIPIPQTLQIICDRPEGSLLQQSLALVMEDIRNGSTFSHACSKHPNVFDTLYVSSLKVGELSGNLVPILERYTYYLTLKINLSRQFSKSMVYPAFLLIVLFIILALLFTFIIPRFVDVYADFNAALPAPTQFLLDIAAHSSIIFPSLFSGIALIIISYRSIRRTPEGRMAIDKMKLHLPFCGRFLYTYIVVHTMRTLSALLDGGLPLVNALQITQESIDNKAYARRLGIAINAINTGESMTNAFRAEKLLPDTAIRMVQAGEQASSLESMLSNVASFEEQRLSHQLNRITALIEPMIILFLGVIVGGIIIAMYLPIFNMTNVVQ